MINLDFSSAIAFYFIFIILVLLGSWILVNGSKQKSDNTKKEFLRQCTICTYIFFEFQDENVCVCPRCKSYLKKEEV